MKRSWLIDSRTIASKVKNPTPTSAYQIKDYEAKLECPNCHYFIHNTDACRDWPGLPAGVKFDPSDAELIEHLAAKCGIGDSKPHPFIDDFIPTVHEDGGICYTHPENLPGAKKDGSSAHLFHRTINAYHTGQRKRRKVYSSHGGPVRWHKTGRTKPVMDHNGVHKGCKKIMVLYKSSKKGCKPDKSNWVMHQYHLGTEEDEKEGEFVVSKIFYQHQKHIDGAPVAQSLDLLAVQTTPRTPNPNTPNLPRPEGSDAFDDAAYDSILQSPFEEKQVIVGECGSLEAAARIEDETEYPEAWLAGESQAVETSSLNGIDESLLCSEIFNSSASLNGSGQNNAAYYHRSIGHTSNGEADNNCGNTNTNAPYGIEVLENLELDTPPYSILPDLQITSQDSVFSWLDRI